MQGLRRPWRVMSGLIAVSVSFAAAPLPPFLNCADVDPAVVDFSGCYSLMGVAELPSASPRDIIRISCAHWREAVEVITLKTTASGWLALGAALSPTPQPGRDDQEFETRTSEREVSQDDWIMARFLFSAVTNSIPTALGVCEDCPIFRLEWAGPSGAGCRVLFEPGEPTDLALNWMRSLSGLSRTQRRWRRRRLTTRFSCRALRVAPAGVLFRRVRR